MSILRVLLVEDEASKVSQWRDAVDTFNADSDQNGFVIESDNAVSVVEAKSHCASRRYDAVVVDLRLKREDGDGPNDDGNTLIKFLIDTYALGIVVYTGQAAEFEDPSCSQVKMLDKADGLGPVFDWIKSQRLLFQSLAGARETIEKETAKVFFSAVWPRWKTWSAAAENVDHLRNAVARHVVAHVHDVLLSRDNAHFEEFYFVPPVKDKLDTGDLVRWGGDLWIVVTPRCDLAAADKTVSVLLAKCKDVAKEWQEACAARKPDTAKGEFQQHKKSFKQHFLPPMLISNDEQWGPWLVQFDDLMVLPISKRDELTKVRMSSLAPHFVPSLVERFGSYFSRIGSPNLSS